MRDGLVGALGAPAGTERVDVHGVTKDIFDNLANAHRFANYIEEFLRPDTPNSALGPEPKCYLDAVLSIECSTKALLDTLGRIADKLGVDLSPRPPQEATRSIR